MCWIHTLTKYTTHAQHIRAHNWAISVLVCETCMCVDVPAYMYNMNESKNGYVQARQKINQVEFDYTNGVNAVSLVVRMKETATEWSKWIHTIDVVDGKTMRKRTSDEMTEKEKDIDLEQSTIAAMIIIYTNIYALENSQAVRAIRSICQYFQTVWILKWKFAWTKFQWEFFWK